MTFKIARQNALLTFGSPLDLYNNVPRPFVYSHGRCSNQQQALVDLLKYKR